VSVYFRRPGGEVSVTLTTSRRNSHFVFSPDEWKALEEMFGGKLPFDSSGAGKRNKHESPEDVRRRLGVKN